MPLESARIIQAMVVIGTAMALAALRQTKANAVQADELIDSDQLAGRIRAGTAPVRLLPPPVGLVPTAFYIPDFISAEDELGLLQHCESQNWIELKRRRLQQFGGQPQADGLDPEPLPDHFNALIDRIMEFKIFPDRCRPNHVLVNQYRPGEGIMAHTDGPLYHPRVAILSTGSSCVMSFYSSLAAASATDPTFQLFLRRRSLLIFQDELYGKYLHQIESNRKDYVGHDIVNMTEANISLNSVYPRSTRTSFTIRFVNPRQ